MHFVKQKFCFFIFIITISLLLLTDSCFASHYTFDGMINHFNESLRSLFFIPIMGLPFIVLWLLCGSIFCTLRFAFPNIRYIKHTFKILSGAFDNEKAKGEISHRQAFATAVGGTVGLGTIAGVAVAVSSSNPGSVIWMAIAGLLGMSTKFVEVTLGFKYRHSVDKNHNTIFGGPFQYMKKGFEQLGFRNLGLILSFLYAVLIMMAAWFGSIALQANQTVSILTNFTNLHTVYDNEIFALILALLTGLTILGGISRIAQVASILAPSMTALYMLSCILIISLNIHNIPDALHLMWFNAFTPEAAGGGMAVAIIAGLRRAVFANECGIGTATIAHASTKDTEPIRAGFVSMLEPFADTVIICCLTGLTIVTTNAHMQFQEVTGIEMMVYAFSTVHQYFSLILLIVVPLFAFSTIIAFGYYGETGWRYIFNNRFVVVYKIGVVLSIYFSGSSNNFVTITELGDTLFMCLSIPNLVAIYFLSNIVAKELSLYNKKYLSTS